MMNEPRDKDDGETISEYLAGFTEELAIDAVGLWQIVPAGRDGFGLSGAELVDFVRRGVGALLAKGARPVVGSADEERNWTLVNYGNTAEEICDAVISEWLKTGRDPNVGDVWFALPDIYEETFAPGERAKWQQDFVGGRRVDLRTEPADAPAAPTLVAPKRSV